MAIARKLLVVAWQVLTHHAVDRHADRPMATRQLPRWGAAHGLASQQGLSSGAFAHQLLDRLGLGASAETAAHGLEGGETRPLMAASDS